MYLKLIFQKETNMQFMKQLFAFHNYPGLCRKCLTETKLILNSPSQCLANKTANYPIYFSQFLPGISNSSANSSLYAHPAIPE